MLGNNLLVFMKGALYTIAMNEEAFVAGLMCSTINEHLMSKAQCGETIQGLVDKAASKFICTEECSKGTVIGSDS